jgi:hypothetical protein
LSVVVGASFVGCLTGSCTGELNGPVTVGLFDALSFVGMSVRKLEPGGVVIAAVGVLDF